MATRWLVLKSWIIWTMLNQDLHISNIGIKFDFCSKGRAAAASGSLRANCLQSAWFSARSFLLRYFFVWDLHASGPFQRPLLARRCLSRLLNLSTCQVLCIQCIITKWFMGGAPGPQNFFLRCQYLRTVVTRRGQAVTDLRRKSHSLDQSASRRSHSLITDELLTSRRTEASVAPQPFITTRVITAESFWN